MTTVHLSIRASFRSWKEKLLVSTQVRSQATCGITVTRVGRASLGRMLPCITCNMVPTSTRYQNVHSASAGHGVELQCTWVARTGRVDKMTIRWGI